MTDVPAVLGPEELEHQKRRRRRMARALGFVVLIAVVAVFVAQNSQKVRVRFWFVTGHPPLIWVILACLAVGVVMGLLVARSRVRTRRRRREERQPEARDDRRRGR